MIWTLCDRDHMRGRNSTDSDTSDPTLHESDTMNELDLELVNALQVQPRGTWAELARPLAVAPSTLARRWERLSAAGLAWVSAVPGREFARARCTAYATINCAHGARSSVITELARYAEVATIEATVGSTDLLLDLLVPDLRALNRFLTEKLDRLAGITSTTVMLVTSLYFEGSRWRLHSLDRQQLTALDTANAQSPPPQSVRTDALDRALLDALVHDGRLSWMELADRTGVSTATARRRVSRLRSHGIVTFRCELANALTNWPLSVSLLGSAPAGEADAVCRSLAGMSGCRVASAVTGPANIFATVWVSDISDIQRLEVAITARHPALTITDRIVGLRTTKRMGHLLDEQGRRTGTRAIAPW
jgi:DNA-binding Lrp family transcriptional regulator